MNTTTSTTTPSRRKPRPFRLLVLVLLLVLIVGLFSRTTTAAEEGMKATWTPNSEDADGAGPLPLSQKQRQQLWQLEQAIVQSPDPTATLQTAAAANDMDPHELAQLLERNHRDLESSGALPSSSSSSSSLQQQQQQQRPRNVLWQALTGLTGLTVHAAVQRPRTFTLTVTVVVWLLYVWLIALPRTGLVLSLQPRGIWTRGPTTFVAPPLHYVQQQLHRQQPNWQRLSDKDNNTARMLLDTWEKAATIIPLPLDQNGVTVHRATKQALKLAVSFQCSMDLRNMVDGSLSEIQTNNNNSDSDDDDDDDDDNAVLEDILHWSWEHAATLLSSRELTEWADTRKFRLVRCQRSNNNDDEDDDEEEENDAVILVVKKLGDWGRYGLVPLRVTYESYGEPDNINDDDFNDESTVAMDHNALQLVLTTVPGAHFDGQIHVIISSHSVDSAASKDDENISSSTTAATSATSTSPLLYVTVRLLVPKHRKCRAPSLAMASWMCQQLSQSVTTSLRLRTRQSLARATQSHHYQQSARRRATERRHHRSEKQRAMEDMAVDRRRRWQRRNPNTGSYRPSGDRMRSPKNAVY